MRSQLESLQEELSIVKSIKTYHKLANSTKVSDATIQKQWSQLAYNIRSLAYCLCAKLEDDMTLPHLRPKPMIIEKSIQSKLGSREFLEMRVHNHLWRLLESLISGRETLWVGSAGQSLQHLRAHMQSKLRFQPMI